MVDNTTRRQFIRASGGITVLALAGCSGSGDDGGDGGSESGDESMDNGSMNDGSMDNETMDDGAMDNESSDDGSMDDDSMDNESMDGDDSMDSGPRTITVRIENVAPTDFYGSDTSTGGQIWITPGAFAVHTGSNPAFTPGETASIGLEAQAEAGPPTGFEGETGLVTELQNSENVATAGAFAPQNTVEDPNDPMGEVPGAPPIAPGGAFEFDIEAEPGQKLSFATMFVPSNDLFFAPGGDGIPLWPDGEGPVEGDVTDAVHLWDAGTEPNGQPGVGPDQAPAQESPDQGADEDGVVRRLANVSDGYSYPDVSNAIQVTLTPQ